MVTFFHNNFMEERWRRAALKNAFSLLGKQRYLHAAAFFLLADSLSDAVDVNNPFVSIHQANSTYCKSFLTYCSQTFKYDSQE
jgi:RAVE protein 1 C terminal